jgi:hypothetical protein
VQGVDRRRVILGGVAAGILMNVLDAITNGVLMWPQLEANAHRLGLDPRAPETPLGIVILGLVDVLYGLVIVWLYALLAPRYGAGWRAALLAAGVVFVSTMGILAGFMLMRVLTPWLLAQMGAAGAFTLAAGGLLGARIYER